MFATWGNRDDLERYLWVRVVLMCETQVSISLWEQQQLLLESKQRSILLRRCWWVVWRQDFCMNLRSLRISALKRVSFNLFRSPCSFFTLVLTIDSIYRTIVSSLDHSQQPVVLITTNLDLHLTLLTRSHNRLPTFLHPEVSSLSLS